MQGVHVFHAKTKVFLESRRQSASNLMLVLDIVRVVHNIVFKKD